MEGHGNIRIRYDYYALLRSLDPHLVGRAEVRGADASEGFLFGIEEALTPEGAPCLRPKGILGGSAVADLRTAVFIRPDVFRPVRRTDPVSPGSPWGCPPTSVDLRLAAEPEARRELVLTVAHHHYASPQARELEAQELTKAADRRDLADCTEEFPNGRPREALVVLDANSYPEPGVEGDVPPPDPSTIKDRSHVRHRFTVTESGELVPDTYSDRALRDVGLEDIARHLAVTTGRTDVLTPAPGYADQGGPCRIDRAYASAGVLSAVEDVRVIDTTGLSDHPILLISFAYRRLAEVLTP
ncbi:hypothetical protein [Streptomyces qinzhouensis]|uniref:Endonuclease/exonuclease/phosphatase family protein n=1 Tax=Streptomyces qinzhouensis TaxID=2599401 RepID=A0A5B8JHY7_9ACTN|nr:hypothetical protein [Streptomyces qinzhouensis]QDY81136.1 hypothetical protein FQU76_18540 [Streptomyces qinzhouensis]